MFRSLIQRRDKIYVGLIIIMIISFPLSFAINSITMFLFILFFFLDEKQNIINKLKQIAKNKLNILFVLFFLVQVIGLLYSEDLDFGLKRVAVMTPLFFLPAILSVEVILKRQFDFILYLTSCIIITIFMGYLFLHVVIDHRDINTFVHFTIEKKLGISQFYLIFLLLIPIMTMINSIRNNQNKTLNTSLLLVTIGISFLLGNKTMFVFVFLIWIMLIVISFKHKKRTGLIVLVLGLTLFTAVSQLSIVKQRIGVLVKTTDLDFETIKTKNSFTITKNTFEHRLLINNISLSEIIENLPFGVGTGDYQKTMQEQYEKLNFKAAQSTNLNCHNQYLSEFLKTGILGGGLFLLIMIVSYSKIKHEQRFYPYFLVFFSLACLVESFLVRQHGIVIFAFIIPLFLYNDNKD
ncbi:MAG: O-antigen ligase [Psychroserpens sp.]|jgi:O-antigen ligase|uniref:O-antigen ligase family protein n=1 Tax=Psychroserpens sp. TaxID=2020870 RepID=UPI0039E48E64